jgi:hypothetical protein
VGSTTIYYIPEAINYRFAFDGIYAYEALSSLNGLNGKRKIGRFFKRIGKGLSKISKKVYKVAKKVIPVASAIATFIPGVGWAVKAGLSAAEMAINYADKKKSVQSREVETSQPVSNRLPVEPVQFTSYAKQPLVNQQANYAKNDIKKLIDAIKSKHQVRPETIQTLVRTQQPSLEDYSRLIELKSQDNVNATTVEAETTSQLRAFKHNIFSEILEELFT